VLGVKPGMEAVWEWKKEEVEKAIGEAEHLLWMVQLEHYPNSRRMTPLQARAEWSKGTERNSVVAMFQVATTLQYPVRVFYECGRVIGGLREHRGCRYGVEAFEYMSGFGRD